MLVVLMVDSTSLERLPQAPYLMAWLKLKTWMVQSVKEVIKVLAAIQITNKTYSSLRKTTTMRQAVHQSNNRNSLTIQVEMMMMKLTITIMTKRKILEEKVLEMDTHQPDLAIKIIITLEEPILTEERDLDTIMVEVLLLETTWQMTVFKMSTDRCKQMKS